jgi:hypothetical protein
MYRRPAARARLRRTGDNGAAFLTQLRQGLATLTGALTRIFSLPPIVKTVPTNVRHHAEAQVVAGMIENQAVLLGRRRA